MPAITFTSGSLAHVIAALQHYRGSLLRDRESRPFDFGLLASLSQNDAAMMAIRDALGNYSPVFGAESAEGRPVGASSVAEQSAAEEASPD